MFVGNILHFNTNCDCCCDWDKQNVLNLVKIGQDKSSVQTYLQRFISCELYPHFLSLSQCFWESEWWLWIWVSNDVICFISNLKRWGKTVNSNKRSFTIKSFKIHSEYCGTMKLANLRLSSFDCWRVFGILFTFYKQTDTFNIHLRHAVNKQTRKLFQTSENPADDE